MAESGLVQMSKLLRQAGEPFAAGYMSVPEAPPVVRMAQGLATRLAAYELPPYQGTRLYPTSADSDDQRLSSDRAAVEWHYCLGFRYNPERMSEKLVAAEQPELRAVAKIPHHLAPGTLVVNIRLAKKFFSPVQRCKLRDLLLTYFELGGMQLQMTVVDQETLRAAMAKPEKYGDLIIRVGGYSEYWSHLDNDLRRAILQRIEHE